MLEATPFYTMRIDEYIVYGLIRASSWYFLECLKRVKIEEFHYKIGIINIDPFSCLKGGLEGMFMISTIGENKVNLNEHRNRGILQLRCSSFFYLNFTTCVV